MAVLGRFKAEVEVEVEVEIEICSWCEDKRAEQTTFSCR